MKPSFTLQHPDTTAQGARQPLGLGFSVFRLLGRLGRPVPSGSYFARPRRSIDRQAQEWWQSSDDLS
jgi:hypothetical protein